MSALAERKYLRKKAEEHAGSAAEVLSDLQKSYRDMSLSERSEQALEAIAYAQTSLAFSALAEQSRSRL